MHLLGDSLYRYMYICMFIMNMYIYTYMFYMCEHVTCVWALTTCNVHVHVYTLYVHLMCMCVHVVVYKLYNGLTCTDRKSVV